MAKAMAPTDTASRFSQNLKSKLNTSSKSASPTKNRAITPALHTPLMAVTNAISSIIIVGAIVAVGPEGFGMSQLFGFIAVTIASVNIFGGFIVTQRMLQMFKKKQ